MKVRQVLLLRGHVIALVVSWCFSATFAAAQGAVEKSLPLEATVAQDGYSLDLSWFDAKPKRVGPVTLNRRRYGRIGGATWQELATLGPVMRHHDATVKPGVAYEYQVLRSARDIVDVGYWLAGTEIPALDHRGHVYVVVDETLAPHITPRLARFERDLAGDGWRVHRHLVPRGDSQKPIENLGKAMDLRAWLQARYHSDPFAAHAVILIGHVPVFTSGNVAPDGHAHGPHATDLFYADMDGRWTLLRSGVGLNSRVPGDFIEMQIGRIDFSFVSAGNTDRELHLLEAYFDKNHHWRLGFMGDLREAYSSSKHLLVETHALRNIVGSQALVAGGHHDVGEEKPWLWGVGFGDWRGHDYAEKYRNKAVFAINFGSGKQKIDGRFGPMTAHLAQPWYTLAVGWGARPAWWLHHMALGGTIGDVHQRTVNNGVSGKPYRETMDYYPNGRYPFRNPIWVNLLGDPTLRAFPLLPPRRPLLRQENGAVVLSWEASADPDVLGYRVYRATSDGQSFERLEDGLYFEGTEFTDTDGVPDARYMIRAYGLKQVHAGSFYTLSQGVFVQAGVQAAVTAPVTLEVVPGQRTILPKGFGVAAYGRIVSVMEGPASGQLGYDGTDWYYTSLPGFSGDVPLRLSVSEGMQTLQERLILRVGK